MVLELANICLRKKTRGSGFGQKYGKIFTFSKFSTVFDLGPFLRVFLFPAFFGFEKAKKRKGKERKMLKVVKQNFHHFELL